MRVIHADRKPDNTIKRGCPVHRLYKKRVMNNVAPRKNLFKEGIDIS